MRRNQIVRIKGTKGTPVRYWGRLARISTFRNVRDKNGHFKGKIVVVQPRNKKRPMAVSQNKLLERD
jgi:hypothetical protein